MAVPQRGNLPGPLRAPERAASGTRVRRSTLWVLASPAAGLGDRAVSLKGKTNPDVASRTRAPAGVAPGPRRDSALASQGQHSPGAPAPPVSLRSRRRAWHRSRQTGLPRPGPGGAGLCAPHSGCPAALPAAVATFRPPRVFATTRLSWSPREKTKFKSFLQNHSVTVTSREV